MAIIGRDTTIAGRYLSEGNVVAIPTETVYGLAADIRNGSALRRVFEIKQRPLSNPLIVHVGSVEEAQSLVREFPPLARHIAPQCWPGPLTMILPKSDLVSPLVTAGQDTVALRIPAHPLTLDLLQQTGLALAAPSANPFNYISPVTAAQVEAMLGAQIPYILDGGQCQRGLESTIIAFEDDRIILLRPGAFTEEDLAQLAGVPVLRKGKENTPAHPGMFKKHYSPRTPLLLSENPWEEAGQMWDKQVAVLYFGRMPESFGQHIKAFMLSPDGTSAGAAANLYNILHELDALGFDCIIAEPLPEEGLGRAVNDRLRKAAQRNA